MAIIKTKPAKAMDNGTGVEKKERKKAPTISERFENYIADLVMELGTDSSEAINELAESIERIARNVMSRHVKTTTKSGSGRGIFYQIFGVDPVIGTQVTPNEVSDRTDGKGALTEAVLKKWADPDKGVPYGKGATAVVKFYRRAKMTDGSIQEAYYKLESYDASPLGEADEHGLNA
jgi:hypothetical protein